MKVTNGICSNGKSKCLICSNRFVFWICVADLLCGDASQQTKKNVAIFERAPDTFMMIYIDLYIWACVLACVSSNRSNFTSIGKNGHNEKNKQRRKKKRTPRIYKDMRQRNFCGLACYKFNILGNEVKKCDTTESVDGFRQSSFSLIYYFAFVALTNMQWMCRNGKLP